MQVLAAKAYAGLHSDFVIWPFQPDLAREVLVENSCGVNP
jgi:hypothetical protein